MCQIYEIIKKDFLLHNILGKKVLHKAEPEKCLDDDAKRQFTIEMKKARGLVAIKEKTFFWLLFTVGNLSLLSVQETLDKSTVCVRERAEGV